MLEYACLMSLRCSLISLRFQNMVVRDKSVRSFLVARWRHWSLALNALLATMAARNRVKPMCLTNLQWHGRGSEIIQSKDRGITMHMARFDVKFSPGFAARKEKVARVQNDYERQIGRL